MILNVATILLLTAGAGFFIAGTVGLLRFPDVYSRLHALTKCDNLGLGFVAIGLAIQSSSWVMALKIIGIWVLVLLASAIAAHLIARRAWLAGIEHKGYGNLMALAFDILLALVLLVLAWNLIRCHDLFQAIVLFISFGFLMALAWVRLNAPDIALAEAAIGSAMTGALLLAALGEFKPSERVDVAESFVIAGLLCLALACVLGYAVLNQPSVSVGLRDVVASSAPETGVENPVTAVFLNFRGYDTLLEVAVLLMAVLAVLSIQNTRPAFVGKPSLSPVLVSGVRILVPILILVSGYLLWVGAHAPGGAFQAGSVLAGAMILATLTDARWLSRIPESTWRIALVFGLTVFILVGAGTVLTAGSLLEYRNDVSKGLILAIETAATLSIACTLVVLLVGRITPVVEVEDKE